MQSKPFGKQEATQASNPLLNFSKPTRKLVFLARSFGKHALELGNEIPARPLYFLKAPSAVLAQGKPLVLPAECETVHYEAEVAVVLQQPLRKANADEAMQAIGAWTILNDVTARSAQAEDGGKFTRAKGYDGFCPMAHQWLPQLDWQHARIQGWLNGRCVQDAPLTDMIFTPGEALAAISQVMTLNSGDLVSFGTPAGVGALAEGDRFEVRLCHDSQASDAQETKAIPDRHLILLSFEHEVISEKTRP